MKVTIFSANPSEFDHEKKQLKEIASILHNDQTDKPVYMLTNVLIGNNEIDCLLLTEKGPFLIDCKSYKGKIYGCENGNWYVKKYSGETVDTQKNFFQQAKRQRFAFLDRWKEIAKKHFERQIPKEQRAYFRVWLYFLPGSTFADDRFNIDAIRWFGVVTADTLIDEIRRSNIQYRLSEQSYAKILKEFGVSIEGASPATILFKKDPEPEIKPEIEPTPEPTPELKPVHKPGDESEKETEIEPEKIVDIETDEEHEVHPLIEPIEPETKGYIGKPISPEPDSESTISVPVIIQKGPIRITIPVRPKSRLPELLNAINYAKSSLEDEKLDTALNYANYALTIDKFDRDAQDIKYEILYRLQRGEEAEEFIEEILRGE